MTGLLDRSRRTGATVVVLLGMSLAGGCAGPQPQVQEAEWRPRQEEHGKALARLDLRMEELSRNLLVLRERMDALEQRAAASPVVEKPHTPLRVVKLDPPQKEVKKSEEVAEDSSVADLYRRAFNAYREGRFGQAILDFEEFLRRYPAHDYADNAQYWTGESYYSQGEYEQAIVEFGRVLERYPHEAKVPDAMLKIGLSYEQLGDLARARSFWDRLSKDQPASEAAREANRKLRSGD